MALLAKNAFQNQEWRDNQENISLGAVGEAKRVVLFDSSGNEIVSSSSLPSGIVTGTKTVATAGTPVQISAGSVTIKGIWLNADIIAAIPVVVGDSGVVGNVTGMKGIILIPGNDPIFLSISELNTLWVDAANNGGKLAYAYLT